MCGDIKEEIDMIVLIKCIQVLLALSLLILIHELGHFAFAKFFGIRVDKFFLFFDAGGVKLFSTKTTGWFTRLFPKMKEADTEYGIGWLPLGGYCKICGMVDESFDVEGLKSEPKPWEFRSKPAWQRLIVMFGGVFNNFLFAIIVYVAMFAIWGDNYVSNKDSRIYANPLAEEMGFRTGDRILSFDDYVPEDFSMLQVDLARRSVHEAKVLRGGDTVSIYIDHNMIGDVLSTPGMFALAIPFVVDSLPSGSINYDSGLISGDRIVRIDTAAVEYRQDATPILRAFAGKSVTASVVRGSDTLAVPLQVDTAGMIGVFVHYPGLEHRDYTVAQAIPAGVKYTFGMIGGYVRDLKLVATPSTGAYKSVGSFISIGQIFPSTWNWYIFVNLLALLSIMLGVMNLIPIPALDGGHMVFAIYEMLTGKKPSDKFMVAAQFVGMFLLMLLMILAFGNDISRLL